MDIYNRKSNSKLISDITINEHIYNVIIEDYYDTSDWVGCKGCVCLMYSHHKCQWCDYILNKNTDDNFKTLRFLIDEEHFHCKKNIFNTISDYNHHNTTHLKEFIMVEKYGLYPTTKFNLLKQTLTDIDCALSDLDIIQLDLGNLKRGGDIYYDEKLATSKILDLPAIVEYDVIHKKMKQINVIHVTINISTIDIKNTLCKILQ